MIPTLGTMSLLLPLLLLLLPLACRTDHIVFPDTDPPLPVDADGDGWPAPGDCDDDDPAIHPGADEVCDEVDNDCDGRVDGQDADLLDGTTWYRDADEDGWGDPNDTIVRCSWSNGYLYTGGDCDDTDPAINPGVDEVCNTYDDNCNGLIDGQDPTLADGTVWCPDLDRDGFGAAGTLSLYRCSQPPGWVADCSDCDDGDPKVGDCGEAPEAWPPGR